MKAGDKTKEQLITSEQKIYNKGKPETCKSYRKKMFRIWFTKWESTRLNWKCRTKNFAGRKLNLKSYAVSMLTCTTLPRLVILLWFKVTAFRRVIES